MDKIYLITSGCYSDYGVHGFFTDEAKANEYCEIQNRAKPHDKYQVEECMDLSRTFLTMNKNPLIKHTVYVESSGVFRQYCSHEICDVIENKITTMHGFSTEYYIDVCLETINDEKAIRIAQDMLAQYKAEQAGI